MPTMEQGISAHPWEPGVGREEGPEEGAEESPTTAETLVPSGPGAPSPLPSLESRCPTHLRAHRSSVPRCPATLQLPVTLGTGGGWTRAGPKGDRRPEKGSLYLLITTWGFPVHTGPVTWPPDREGGLFQPPL